MAGASGIMQMNCTGAIPPLTDLPSHGNTAGIFRILQGAGGGEHSVQPLAIIYELLDEPMDFGYPQTTDSKILQE